MSEQAATNHRVPFTWEMLAILLTLLIAGVVAYITFVGLINSQVNSASNDPGNVSAPVIDYGTN